MAKIIRLDLDSLGVLCYPDKRLRVRAEELEEIDGYLGELAHRMAEMLHEHEGIGLAATQLGWPHRFVVINPTLEQGRDMALINPVIVERDGQQAEEEGCLSVPGIRAKVRRADYVKVRARLLNGKEVEFEGEGLRARLVQHELDHLDGRLFVDRLGPASRVIVSRQLRNLSRRQSRE